MRRPAPPSGSRPVCCTTSKFLAVLQSLGERCDQVPGVPPAGPGDHAHHQVIYVSKDEGMFSLSDSISSSTRFSCWTSLLVLISDFAIRYGLGYNLGNGNLRNFGFVGKQVKVVQCYISLVFNNFELLKRSLCGRRASTILSLHSPFLQQLVYKPMLSLTHCQSFVEYIPDWSCL